MWSKVRWDALLFAHRFEVSSELPMAAIGRVLERAVIHESWTAMSDAPLPGQAVDRSDDHIRLTKLTNAPRGRFDATIQLRKTDRATELLVTVGVPLWHLLLFGAFTLLVLGAFTTMAPMEASSKSSVLLFLALLSLVQLAYLRIATGREARRLQSVLGDLD
jgi:hypothetical protein